MLEVEMIVQEVQNKPYSAEFCEDRTRLDCWTQIPNILLVKSCRSSLEEFSAHDR